jgi:hypothetical protein
MSAAGIFCGTRCIAILQVTMMDPKEELKDDFHICHLHCERFLKFFLSEVV